MRAATTVTYDPDAPRASLIVPRSLAVFVAGLSLTLLAIGAMSPYTHSNLVPGYDRAYTRTDQILVGAPVPFGGIGGTITAGDEVTIGERLFVAEGCVTCHGIGGRGGVVGPAIEHNDAQTLRQRTRMGPEGMPRFSDALTDDEIAAISAYLRSVAAPKGGTP
jgi:mono/diheme cytochrome c family protein